MDINKIDYIKLTNIYIQQNNLAQGLTEEEFVKKYIYILEKISKNFSNYKSEYKKSKINDFIN